LQHRDEIPDHPWYVAVQFHPEFKSKPLRPHPLFAGLVEAAVQQGKRKVRTGATVTAISDRVAR
jgi:CTP synthase